MMKERRFSSDPKAMKVVEQWTGEPFRYYHPRNSNAKCEQRILLFCMSDSVTARANSQEKVRRVWEPTAS